MSQGYKSWQEEVWERDRREKQIGEQERTLRPKTIVVSGRVNDCTLADLHAYFEFNGIRISKMSDLLRTSLESFREVLARNNKLNVYHQTTREGREYLRKKGLITESMAQEKRSRNLFLNQVNLECQMEAPLTVNANVSGITNNDLQDQISKMNMQAMTEELFKLNALRPNSEEGNKETEQLESKFCIQTNEEADLRDQLLGAIPSGLTKPCE